MGSSLGRVVAWVAHSGVWLLLQFNFVGKLLGPKGNSLKRLQEDTLCKMAVLGRGSMKDRQKVRRAPGARGGGRHPQGRPAPAGVPGPAIN